MLQMSNELLTNVEPIIMEVRAASTEDRIVEGIAVPYNQVAQMGYFQERVAPGAVELADTVQLKYEHKQVIGKVIAAGETADGFVIRARISETPLGDEVYTLVKDGAINKFSIGFEPVADKVGPDNIITRTKILVREVSLVPQPAYEGAAVLSVRSDSQDLINNEVPQELSETRKESIMENIENMTAADLNEVRESVTNLERKLEVVLNKPEVETPVLDTRSAGEVVKAYVAGKDATLERAYTGGTTADAVVKDGWVGDLTRIVDEAAVLRNLFSRGALPAEGNNVEFAELDANTIDVDVQVAEGDDLTFGLVSVTSRTAPVKTFGGYSTLSRQEIERASVNMVDATLRGMASAAGKALNAQMRSHFTTAVAAQITAGNKVTVPATGATYGDWLDAIIDAAAKYETIGLTLDGLIVDKATFKGLMALEAADGRPVFLVEGQGSNNIGSVNVRTLRGSLANIPVIMDAGLGAGVVSFYNAQAITEYTSGVARLQDDNIINLSRDFSVYMYSAVASTIPAALVGVELV
jgi:HK97 family phage prohead protease/HK97 family phage major capsid protein